MVKWNRTDDLLKPIVSLYQQIWNSNTDCTEQFKRHMDYEGFRGYVCLDEEEMPVGFAYGLYFSIRPILSRTIDKPFETRLIQ